MNVKVLLLAGCIVGGVWSAAAPARAQDATAGQAVFKSQCTICHSATAGKNMTGPSLFDIAGRKAGQVAGFHYSEANKNSGLTWDAATLDKYLTSPKDVVPHTIMAYPGLKDAQKRANLIAYLATLR
jgi:cytochrome c